jgi:hypothetical protein
METTKLTTVDQVTEAIVEAIGMPMRPAKAERARCARLADLHEIRARLFVEAVVANRDQVPEIFVHAANLAAGRDMDRARQFRRQAGGAR